MFFPDLSKTQSIAEFMRDRTEQWVQTLLALDTPLGRPHALGKALFDQSAGSKIGIAADNLIEAQKEGWIWVKGV